MAQATRRYGNYRLWLVPAAILAIGLGLSVYVYARTRAVDEERVKNALELRVEWRAHDFRNRLDDALVPVEALAAFVASQDKIDFDEFHRLAVSARGDDPISSLVWTPWVLGSERGAFEATARRNGHAGYEIRESEALNPTHLVPAPPRADYAPILNEEIFEPRPSLVGFNLIADPKRRATAERARDEGTAIATPPVMPAFRTDRTPIYLVFWPVYLSGSVPATIAERRAQLLGFSIGAFRIDEVADFALLGSPDATSRMSILIGNWNGESTAVPAILVRPHLREVELGHDPLGALEPGGLRFIRTFSTLGQDWTLVFDYPPEAVDRLRSPTDWSYLAFGTLLTLLLAAYVALELRRRRSVENLVAERTRDLAETNETLRHEIEGREIAQAELGRAGDQLKAMIDASPAGIVCVDPDLHVLIWNKSAERIFGYRANEVVGRADPLIPDEERETFVEAFNRALKGTVLRNQLGHRRRRDGTVIETNYSAAAFHDQNGAVLGVVYAYEDVTERNRLQNQFLRAQKLETVGQLTGGLAHDFNNILGAVVGNLDLLTESVAKDPTAAAYCKEALDAALSGAELVKRMLAFSRRQPLRPKPMDINDAVVNVRPLILRSIGEHIKIETRLADDLWPAVADAIQLESAVLNLAVNARDAMPGGGTLTIVTSNVTIDDAFVADAAGDLDAGDYVVLSVGDAGTGIAPEVLAHAFEPFFTTKAPGKGSGLGLSMVFGTMKQLGGTARIYSEVGIGTTVRLYLPRGLKAEESTAADNGRTESLPSGTERILLVEDNIQIRSVGLGILQGLGYHVTVAENGDAAMRLIENGAGFDLLFTDVVMPGKLNGIALAYAVREIHPEIRILFASGFTSPMTVRTDIDRLDAELLLKPYRRAELARLVRTVLDRPAEIGA